MSYVTDQFILNGTVDFVVSQGLVESKKPYFFIQEFKKSEDYGNPRPQHYSIKMVISTKNFLQR